MRDHPGGRFVQRRPKDAVEMMAQTELLRTPVRNKLITLLPRLRRFAVVLAGESESADALLRTTCKKMLDDSESYQQGTAFDIWALHELHEEWLGGLRSHNSPISHGHVDASLFASEREVCSDVRISEIAEILAKLPPQQRGAVLLVYGEGLSYEDAATVLDTDRQTVLARVSRALASFIERADWLDSADVHNAEVQHLQQINRQTG